MLGYFLVVILILVALIFGRRAWLYSVWLTHLLYDYYLYNNFKKKFKKTYFYGGWGKEEDFEEFHQKMTEFPKYPLKINVEWKSDEVEESTGTRIRCAKFLSPMSDLLPEEEKSAFFWLYEPKDEEKSTEKRIAIIPPAGGQKSPGWRYREYGKYLLSLGISVIITIMPGGKDRVKGEYSSDMESVQRLLIVDYSLIEEARAAARFAIEELGYQKLCLTGQCWGGMVSTNIAKSSKYDICDYTEFPHDIYVVPFLSNGFLASRDFIRRLQKEKSSLSELPIFLRPQNWEEMKKRDPNLNDPVLQYEWLLEERYLNILGKEGKMSDSLQVRGSIIIHAKSESLISAEEMKFQEEAIWEIFKRSENDDEDLDVRDRERRIIVRWIGCGHFTPFVVKRFRKEYMEAVLEVFKIGGNLGMSL